MEPPSTSSSGAGRGGLTSSSGSSQPSTNSPNLPAYFLDIKNLITTFHKTGSLGFPEFKKVWKEQKFSLIHLGKPRDLDHREYTQALFSSAFGFIFPNQPLNVRMAVLYCLYLLYNTQPQKPKVLINVSFETWHQLLRLYTEIKQHKLAEAYHIFRKMHKEPSFCFCAYAPVGPMFDPTVPAAAIPELPAELASADTLRGVIDLEPIEYLSKLYSESKTHAQAAVDMLTQEQEALGTPSLNVANLNLAGELRALLSDLERAYSHNKTYAKPPSYIPSFPPTVTTQRSAEPVQRRARSSSRAGQNGSDNHASTSGSTSSAPPAKLRRLVDGTPLSLPLGLQAAAVAHAFPTTISTGASIDTPEGEEDAQQ